MMIRAYKLANWTVFPDSNELKSDNETRRLESRAMDVLLYLCENPNRVISQSELKEEVWGRTAISDNSPSVAIAAIRKGLGDDVRSPKFVETVKTKGYRLLVEPKPLDVTVSSTTRRPRWLATSVTALVLAVCVIGALAIFESRHDPAPLVIYLGPIVNGTGIPQNDLVAEAIGDVLVAEFSLYDSIIVRKALDSSLADALNLDAPARSAAALLAGRLVADSAGLTLALHLQERDTANVLWGRSAGISSESLISDIESIAADLVVALDMSERGADPGDAERISVDLLYARAQQLASVVSDVTILLAHDLLLEAISIDPEHGPSRALLAEMYSWHYPPSFWGLEGDRFELAEQQLDLARRFGAEEAYLLVTEAGIRLARERDYEHARQLLHQAAVLRPDDPWVLRPQIWANMLVGDFEAALEYSDRAAAASLDPRSAYVERVVPLYYTGRFEEASRLYAAAADLGLKPSAEGPRAATMMGDEVTAFRRWVQFIRAQGVEVGDETRAAGWIESGDATRAYDWLRSRAGVFTQDWSFPLISASWHIAAGDQDAAAGEIASGIRIYRTNQEPEGRPGYHWTLFLHDPLFADVRADTRVAGLMDLLVDGRNNDK